MTQTDSQHNGESDYLEATSYTQATPSTLTLYQVVMKIKILIKSLTLNLALMRLT